MREAGEEPDGEVSAGKGMDDLRERILEERKLEGIEKDDDQEGMQDGLAGEESAEVGPNYSEDAGEKAQIGVSSQEELPVQDGGSGEETTSAPLNEEVPAGPFDDRSLVEEEEPKGQDETIVGFRKSLKEEQSRGDEEPAELEAETSSQGDAGGKQETLQSGRNVEPETESSAQIGAPGWEADYEAKRVDTAIEGTESRQHETDGVGSGAYKKPQETETGQASEATSQVESYDRNVNQVVVTEQESNGGRSTVPADSAESSDLRGTHAVAEPEYDNEAREFEAVDYGKGANVRVPKTDLEAEGYDPPDHNAVVRLGLRDIESADVETAFARYIASDRRAEAYVGDIGGEKGGRYELVEAREVSEDILVKDFRRGRCEHLQNICLEHVDDKMFLNVDNRRVELEDYRISTSGAHAVLSGRLDGKDSCKFEFDGHRASVKFGRDYHVEEMKMEGDDMVVRYAQSRNERHEHRIPLEHRESPERPSLDKLDKEEMKERIKIIDRPERIEGVYQFVLDRASSAEVQRLLTEARERDDNDYGMMKAEISERLVPNMLEIAGWERIKWHPFNHTEKKGADAPGTDWLLRTPDGKEVLVEFKWYENIRDAIRKATMQVEKDFRQHRDDPDLKLEGAYIAIVDYDGDSEDGRPIKVRVLRVQPKEELR